MPDVSHQYLEKNWRVPNLGIASIAGNIQSHHEIILADLVLKRDTLQSSIKTIIEDYQPDYVPILKKS